MARNILRERFANYFSRSAVKVRNNLGIIAGDDREGVRKVRNKELEIYDAYYDGTQYDKLPRWEDSQTKDSEYIPIRKRQPRIIINFAKVLVDRLTSKLVGDSTFPKLKIEDDPDTNIFIGMVMKTSMLAYKSLETVRLMARAGSAFMRYSLIDGGLHVESYHSKYCYPVFTPGGKLESIKITYVYEDQEDRDTAGNYKKKWFRMDLTATVDTLYDNPEYQMESQPTFNVVSEDKHDLGFVQGYWFRTGIDKHSPDGPSLIADCLDLIDELNYNISQSSQAVGYNQEPQLAFKSMDSDGVEKLIRSSSRAWNLGKDGEAKFIETTMEGVKTAAELRDKVRLAMQDVARVIMLDPEKVVGHAQSGKAMEVLHGPMVELIMELRPLVEAGLIEMATKMAVTVLKYASMGFQTEIQVPPGYQPTSLEISAHWPQIFPMTMEDLNNKLLVAVAATTNNLISRETATRWIATDFGVEDVDAELEKLETQEPFMDPFATYGTAPHPDAPGGENVKEKV